MYINTSGIVLREVQYKDTSKILTVLTSSEGKLTVSAHGAHRKNSKLAAVTGLLVFSEMTLLKKKDRWTMTEARSVEQFIGLRDDLKLLALGTYIAELTEALSDEDSPNPELLPLCLNTLYALSEKLKPPEFVKPAFELRLMAISGFEPLLRTQGDNPTLGDNPTWGDNHTWRNGSAVSNISPMSIDDGALTLTSAALCAADYILSCDAKKLFSFTLSDVALKELSKKTEEYLLAHLDRSFRTLDYYHKV